MSESYSVKARLSAQDSGFTSTLTRAVGAVKDLGSSIKGGFAFGILSGIGQQAFSTITGSVSELIGEVNNSNASWKTFTKNMQMVGKSEKEIESVKNELQDFAQKTVYSSSDMATTFAQLEAVGVKNTTSLVKGFGGLAAAAENPQQAMKTLSQQATQMAAKPAVAWEDFKLLLEQSPAGIAAVAKEMGMSTAELVTHVQDGKLETDKFFEAISKVGTNDAFTELATEAKTVGQAVDGLKETIGNKLMPSFEVLNKKAIGIVNKLADKFSGINAEALATKVSNTVDKCAKYFNAFKEAFSGVGTEVWSAVKEIGSALFGMEGAFGSASSVDGFKSAMTSVANVIKSVASFAKEHAGAIAKLIKWLPAIVVGIKGFKIASAVAPGITMFAKGIAGLASKGIGGIASKLFGISKAQSSVGEASLSTGGSMLQSAKSFALMGAAVLLVAAGFALLAFSAISLANAGGGAIAVMAGLVVALAALGVGMALLLKTLAPMSGQLMPVATSMLAMGAAVLLVAAGFALLAQASIALAESGGLAIGIMVGMVVAIALLAVGAALLAPVLTAGAAGLLAFGAAMLLCGAAAALAALSVKIIASTLPMLAEYGLQGALALTALGVALSIFATGAIMAGAGALVLGAGLAVAAIGLTACAVAAVILGAGMLALGAGILLAAAGLTLFSLQLPIVATYGQQGAVAIVALGAGLIAFAAGALIAAPACMALGAGLLIIGASALVASAGVIAFGAGITICAAGMLVMVAALKGVSSQMKTIASNAKAAQKSLTSMQKSVKAVESGLNALGSKAKSAMQKLTSAFDDTASKAKASGKKVGESFTQGLQTGLSQAPAVALMVTKAVSNNLKAGATNAFSAGSFISQGFANGMLSMLGVIRSAASKMAAAADKAVRAKAKISSPSKVASQLGTWWGEGYENGLLDTVKHVWDAAEKLVSIPTVATPDLTMSYGGELSADYDYYRNAEYTIVVPLSVDGKEFAKAEAKYMQDELDKEQSRNDRKHGRI